MSTENVVSQKPLLYSVAQVSELLNVSSKTVYRLIERGHLKACKVLRHKLIPVESVTEFIARTIETCEVAQ